MGVIRFLKFSQIRSGGCVEGPSKKLLHFLFAHIRYNVNIRSMIVIAQCLFLFIQIRKCNRGFL